MEDYKEIPLANFTILIDIGFWNQLIKVWNFLYLMNSK